MLKIYFKKVAFIKLKLTDNRLLLFPVDECGGTAASIWLSIGAQYCRILPSNVKGTLSQLSYKRGQPQGYLSMTISTAVEFS